MRHVVVEGPDGAGKTVLAKALCKTMGYAYHHEGPPPKDASVLHHYGGLLANAKRPTVFDRLHLGETVYGPLLRGESGLAPSDLILLERLIKAQGTAIVVCLPPWDTTAKNTKGRKELIKDKRVLEEAYAAWTVVACRSFANVQVHDYTKTEFILRSHASLPDGVVGDPRATTLIVGEQPNSVDLAFFGGKRSSGYLNERLAEAGYGEGDLALTNALYLNGKPRDLRAIVASMRPRLKLCVGLGRVAAAALADAGAPKVADLPHPQYWKRFHASATAEYTRMLQRTRSFA